MILKEKSSSTNQDAVIQAMLKPEIYPDSPEEVTHLQTYISHIFLTGKLAYKIKKPVHYSFLDFSTLKKRKYFCKREIELNKRLAEDMYLDVQPIYKNAGIFVVGGKKGTIVE